MLRYSTDEPLVVGLIVSRPGHSSACWVVSRDLLSAGLTGTAGIGDITAEPVAEHSKPLAVLLRVRSEEGEARIHIDHQALLLYLERSHAMMPFGSEAQPDRPTRNSTNCSTGTRTRPPCGKRTGTPRMPRAATPLYARCRARKTFLPHETGPHWKHQRETAGRNSPPATTSSRSRGENGEQPFRPGTGRGVRRPDQCCEVFAAPARTLCPG
ncbi:SsgA family sporulation/cell division regulator [Streptomyces sp. NBC_00009]